MPLVTGKECDKVVIKLIIAGIKWLCNVQENIFHQSILTFAEDFDERPDINLKVAMNYNISLPSGKSITKDILDWYIEYEGAHRYHLLKRNDENNEIRVSLKANETWSDILIEMSCFNKFTIDFINIVLLEVVFRNGLLFHNGLVIHSSCLEFKGEAIAFAAPSGTGKSTHARLWQEIYDAHVVNDDHPAVRIIDGKVIAFGTPWAGERQMFDNSSSALKGFVILEQGPSNKLWKLNKKDILKELLPRCFLPYYCSDLLQKAAEIFSGIINKTNVYKLICKPEPEAAMLVKENVWPQENEKHRMVSYE
ncbi:MAG: hypothetical protein H6Q59_2792 [Firmicutes bacterium]|nr:hypothetical protein [Bacillota bacterium]